MQAIRITASVLHPHIQNDLTKPEIVRVVLDNIAAMEKKFATTPRPFIYTSRGTASSVTTVVSSSVISRSGHPLGSVTFPFAESRMKLKRTPSATTSSQSASIRWVGWRMAQV